MSLSVSLVAPSLAATHRVAATIAGQCRPGDIVLLAGEMGAGKTAFAQGFGKALGVTEPITSPTFTLVQTYDTPYGQFHHADVYRLEQLHEVADLALGELAEFRGVVVVEWGDVVSATIGDHLQVRLDLADEPLDTGGSGDAVVDSDARQITVTPSGQPWIDRWPTLSSLLDKLDLSDEETD